MSERVVVASSPRSTPASSLRAVEGEEVRALLALDVDDLDELARAHLVGERRRGVHAEVEPGLGERGRELELLVRARGARAAPRRGARRAGGAPSTIRPAGAATTTVTARSARNVCAASGGDHSPNSRTAVASAGIEAAGAELVDEQAAVA